LEGGLGQAAEMLKWLVGESTSLIRQDPNVDFGL
jgi:hypothetical protein